MKKRIYLDFLTGTTTFRQLLHRHWEKEHDFQSNGKQDGYYQHDFGQRQTFTSMQIEDCKHSQTSNIRTVLYKRVT